MRRPFVISIISIALILIPLGSLNLASSSEQSEETPVLRVIQHMESDFKTIEDYTCEVEQIFYQNGAEDQRYRFKFYFKKKKRIRIDFSHPYPSLTLFYSDGDREATVMPFRSITKLKFHFSIFNPLIKTLAGQRIDQTDMGHFINFMSKNSRRVKQEEDEFYEDQDRVEFFFWAMDYIEEKSIEKYQISISKRYWLPIHIERYRLDGKPLETTDIKNYTINSHLQDRLFVP
jgi:outer membrane lipoprotein-sorting protein